MWAPGETSSIGICCKNDPFSKKTDTSVIQPAAPEPNDYQVALSNCAQEPIHIPGRVQGFGSLLVCRGNDSTVVGFSENVREITGMDPPKMGEALTQWMSSRELYHEIRGAMGLPTIATQRERLGIFDLDGRSIDAAIHRCDDRWVIEMEPDRRAGGRPDASVSQVRAMLGGLQRQRDNIAFIQSACEVLRRTTGFDRVLGYQFMENGDGNVVAESLGPAMSPYLGLRYPASDIPRQVRDAMLKMPFRCIADIDLPQHAVRLADGEPPIDLTLSHCRGVSPIHLEYLRNMGVRSTLNLAIIRQGELWGLFAFHHDRPRTVPPHLRSICELFGQFFSLELQQQLDRSSMTMRSRAASLQRHLRGDDQDRQSLVEAISPMTDELMRLLDADGLFVSDGDQRVAVGNQPSAAVLERMCGDSFGEVITSESLRQHPSFAMEASPDEEVEGTELKGTEIKGSEIDGGDANRDIDWDDETIAGALVIPLDHHARQTLIAFRMEVVQEVRWAGAPDKRIEFGPNGPRLHPRASFDEYIESVRGRSRPWHSSQIAAATELRGALLDRVIRHSSLATQQWRRQQEYQELLISELNHRVKNVLALVRSIARQTRTDTKSLAQYAESFEQRITALATAHDLVGGTGSQWVPLREILEIELRPYRSLQTRIELDGSSISLKSDIAPVMALVVHELATNAAKYGALSHPDSSLNVRWREQLDGVELVWKETLSSRNLVAGDSGFGLSLVRRAIPHECGGQAQIVFRPDGFEGRFWLPSRVLQTDASPSAESSDPAEIQSDPQLAVQHALVVEDGVVLSIEMESMLRELGVANVHCAGELEQAQRYVESQRFDLAVLDINLAGHPVFEVAEALRRQNVPIIFVSGCEDQYEMPTSLLKIPALTKPIDKSRLAEALRRLLSETP